MPLQDNPKTIKFEQEWYCGRKFACSHQSKFRAWIHTLLWPFHPPSRRLRMFYVYDKPKP